MAWVSALLLCNLAAKLLFTSHVRLSIYQIHRKYSRSPLKAAIVWCELWQINSTARTHASNISAIRSVVNIESKNFFFVISITHTRWRLLSWQIKLNTSEPTLVSIHIMRSVWTAISPASTHSPRINWTCNGINWIWRRVTETLEIYDVSVTSHGISSN